MAFSFFGGVHPKENKLYACDVPIREFPEPDVLVVPMSQHIGTPCRPLVKKGDLVKVGQKIGDHVGLCAPVHAPVSGKVKSVEMKAHTSGTTETSVVIENDHLGTLCPDIRERSKEEVDGLMKLFREVPTTCTANGPRKAKNSWHSPKRLTVSLKSFAEISSGILIIYRLRISKSQESVSLARYWSNFFLRPIIIWWIS